MILISIIFNAVTIFIIHCLANYLSDALQDAKYQ